MIIFTSNDILSMTKANRVTMDMIFPTYKDAKYSEYDFSKIDKQTAGFLVKTHNDLITRLLGYNKDFLIEYKPPTWVVEDYYFYLYPEGKNDIIKNSIEKEVSNEENNNSMRDITYNPDMITVFRKGELMIASVNSRKILSEIGTNNTIIINRFKESTLFSICNLLKDEAFDNEFVLNLMDFEMAK